MIVIAQPYAHFRETVRENSLEQAGRRLLQLGESRARQFYGDRFPGYEISVEADIEIGSTKTWIAISTVASTLVFYGAIRQSIDYLIKDAQYVGDMVLPHVSNAVGLSSEPTVSQRRLGLPGQLHRLFEAVGRHELTPDEATKRAAALFDSYEAGHGELEGRGKITKQLSRELKQAHRSGHYNPRPRPTPAPPPDLPVLGRPRNGIRVSRDTNGEIVYRRDPE